MAYSPFKAGAQTTDGKYFVCTGNIDDPKASGTCQEVSAIPSDIITFYTCTASGNNNYNCNYTYTRPLPPSDSFLQTATITSTNGGYIYTPTGPSNVINTNNVKSYAQWSPSTTSNIVIWVIIILVILYLVIAVNKRTKKVM